MQKNSLGVVIARLLLDILGPSHAFRQNFQVFELPSDLDLCPHFPDDLVFVLGLGLVDDAFVFEFGDIEVVWQQYPVGL